MWKIIGCLFVLGLAGQALGQATVLLSGTLKIGTDCLQAGGATIAADNCLEVIVVEEGGVFKVQTLAGDPRTQLTLADGGNSLMALASGSSVKFSSLDNANAFTTKAQLTDANAPFYIRLSDDTADPGKCIQADGTALHDCVEADKWFFEEVSCKVTSCATCNADVLLCDTCDANKIANDDKTACEECSTLNAQCTECSETGGTQSCTACAAGYITDVTDVCKGCEEEQYVAGDVCTDCASGKTVNSARDGCVEACTDSNCKFCDDGPGTCGTCNDGYKVEDGGCKEESDENIAAGVVPLRVLLVVVVLTVALLI